MKLLWAWTAFALHCTTLTFVAGLPFPFKKRTSVCNGHAELCSRSYSNVTFIGAHDSFAYSDDIFAISRDQRLNISEQLELGVRLLQAQSHVEDNELHFCHTSCSLFDFGTVLEYLKIVKTFLDGHPNEVLTFIFTNPERQPVDTVWRPIFDQAGLTAMAYVPPHVPLKYSEWPTLGQMIQSGKRLVVFLDTGANTTAVDFILPEFEMVWETPFSVTNASFPCSIDRIQGPLPPEDRMYMINHSLNKNVLPIGPGIIVSDPMNSNETNSVQSIMDNVRGCAPLASNRNPNFLLLDFVEDGEAFKAAEILNGLQSLDPPAGNSTSTSVNSGVKLRLSFGVKGGLTPTIPVVALVSALLGNMMFF
ncbi:PLC-like phosphodiesterase [Marasmius fiardii PR-910]|nr:PLC-like phosphodiesterase [Marasmius fiardii PR-910]